MRLIILFIGVANCFSIKNENFKKISDENANKISENPSEAQNHKETIIDQFYDYLEKVKRVTEIEKEKELLRENALKSRKSFQKYRKPTTGIVEDSKNNLSNDIRQNRHFFGRDESYNQENFKHRHIWDFPTKNFRSNFEHPQRQSDQNQMITPWNDELEVKRNKRNISKDFPNNSQTTIENVENYTPKDLEAREEYLGEPSRIHISEIKEELNKLQDLVEILRDQQYILSLLNNIDNRDDRLAKNSTRVSKLNNMFENFKNGRQEKGPQKEDEESKAKTEDQHFSLPSEENKPKIQRILPKNLIHDANSLDVFSMKQEVDQLKTTVLDILKKRKQSNTDEKEKEITEELENQKKEINLLKQMIIKLSGPRNEEPINETHLPTQAEESDENNRLQHMLGKLYAAEEKLNSIMGKQPEDDSSSDEIVASTASTRFKHPSVFPRHNEYKNEKPFQKNNYLTDLLNKTARTGVNLHKLRASDSDNEFRSILTALTDNKQKVSRKKELVRIQKELASLRKLTQNDGNNDAEDIESLLNDLDIQRDDSLELNSDSDIADKILDLEEQIKSKMQTSKKTDVHKTLRELERQIKALNEKDDKKARLIKLFKKMKDTPESKSLSISEDDEDIAGKLRLLKDTIDNLQPKEDDVSVEEEGKENANFGLMLQKLISGRKPKPSVAKPTANKLQSLTNKLATLLNKHPPSIEPNLPDEDTNFNLSPIDCKYGGFNSDQNSGNSFADNGYGDYRPNYDFAPSNVYGKGKVYSPYKPNSLPYGQDFSPSNYSPIKPFPQTIKPYPPNGFMQNYYNHFPSTYNPEVPYVNDVTPTPYYPRPQPSFNYNSKMYPPPQRQHQPTFNYKTRILNSIPNNLFHGPKTNGQKIGYLKTYSDAQKPQPTPYAANAQKYPFDQPQNYQVDDVSSQNRINDLKKQIYNLQNVINTLNRPEYIQRPEDKITAYNLDKQITDLKNIINYLSHNPKDYQGSINKQYPESYPNFPDGNYQNVKIQVLPNDNNYNSETANENSDQNNSDQIYSNTPDAAKTDLPNYEDASLHARPNFESASNQNLNTPAAPNEVYPSDESGTRYERSVDLNPNSTDTFNNTKFERTLNELIDDMTSKIEAQVSTGTAFPEGFTSEMENYLLNGLVKLSDSDERLASLFNYLLKRSCKNEGSKLSRRKRSSTDGENYSSELLPLLLSGKEIDKEFSEETENDDGRNLSDLNILLEQLKTQLDAVPQTSNARVSKQPYQKPNNYYYQAYSKTKPKQSLFPFSNKKRTKKLDVFGKIVDKILDKVIDKAPIVVFKLMHRFFGLGNQDLSAQGGNYYEGGLQSFQNFGLSGLLPMVILRVFSNLSYFISQLQRSRFMRNFLVPGLILLGVSGMVVFLIWWLQTDNYTTQQYSHGQGSDYSTKNYYGNQMDNYGSGYSHNQYENSYNKYKNDYNTNSYGYSMIPYEKKNNYNYNPYLRSTNNLNRNNYNQNDNLYYYRNMLNKQIRS